MDVDAVRMASSSYYQCINKSSTAMLHRVCLSWVSYVVPWYAPFWKSIIVRTLAFLGSHFDPVIGWSWNSPSNLNGANASSYHPTKAEQRSNRHKLSSNHPAVFGCFTQVNLASFIFLLEEIVIVAVLIYSLDAKRFNTVTVAPCQKQPNTPERELIHAAVSSSSFVQRRHGNRFPLRKLQCGMCV